MNVTTPSPWGDYANAFRTRVHQLLAWGYADARPRLRADLDEPALTGLLAEAIQRRIDYDTTIPEDYSLFRVLDQAPENPDGSLMGTARRRLDLAIVRAGMRPQPVFSFEAKRLLTGGYTIGKYVGEGGMGDYVSGRYKPDHTEAAMLGLMQNKDAAYWLAQLRAAFAADSASPTPRLAILSGPSAVKMVADIPFEWESHHGRIGLLPLRLYHLFLDCS